MSGRTKLKEASSFQVMTRLSLTHTLVSSVCHTGADVSSEQHVMREKQQSEKEKTKGGEGKREECRRPVPRRLDRLNKGGNEGETNSGELITTHTPEASCPQTIGTLPRTQTRRLTITID